MKLDSNRLYDGKGVYRGRRLDNNEWVDGGLLPTVNDRCWIATSFTEHDDGTKELLAYEVDPNTIGEFIGVYDDDDDLIFEGMEIEVIRHKTDKYLLHIEDIRNLPELMFGSAVTNIKIVGDIK